MNILLHSFCIKYVSSFTSWALVWQSWDNSKRHSKWAIVSWEQPSAIPFTVGEPDSASCLVLLKVAAFLLVLFTSTECRTVEAVSWNLYIKKEALSFIAKIYSKYFQLQLEEGWVTLETKEFSAGVSLGSHDYFFFLKKTFLSVFLFLIKIAKEIHPRKTRTRMWS